MQEESKEEYLARHRKSIGPVGEEANVEVQTETNLKTKIKNWLYLILLLVFVWIIYQMFGMMKSN
jgi:hypothetical protein